MNDCCYPMVAIHFEKYKYDPFIDFLKGCSIVFVILTHTISSCLHDYSFFCLWGDMAVPIFLLIQIFHAYKTPCLGGNKFTFNKIAKRIILPFIISQFIGLIISIVYNGISLHEIKKFGNFGPGAYYPYIYLQFAVLLAIIAPLIRKLSQNPILFAVLFVVISELFEMIACYSNISQGIYRLLFTRYTFLIYLGARWTAKPIMMDVLTVILSIISALFIILFQYFDQSITFEPWFYMKGWKIFHWISYFYVANLLVWILRVVYDKCGNMLLNSVKELGKYSYEIFLFQMIYFMISPLRRFSWHAGGMEEVIIPILDVILCTTPIVIYKRIKLAE